MIIHNLYVEQVPQRQVYNIYLPNGIQIGAVSLGTDFQVAYDLKVLEIICKAIAMRYGLVEHKRRNNRQN